MKSKRWSGVGAALFWLASGLGSAPPAAADPLQDCAQEQVKLPTLTHKNVVIEPRASAKAAKDVNELRACMRRWADRADARMDDALRALESAAPALAEATATSQRTFSAFREQTCALYAARPESGVDPEAERLDCAIRLADQRAADLRRLAGR